ncbi:MAG TPA: glycosyltransferase family 39 protein [Planctomycetota bacterium]|nr:glycosyltransferase family 39 protein [Planctomycetota bacterium]
MPITDGPRRAARLALLALAFAVAGFGLTRTLGEPFAHGWMGHNGARYAHIARNYARDGLLFECGAPRMDVAQGGAESVHSYPLGDSTWTPDVYAHHPPAVSMVIGLLFDIFGVSEDVARVLPILATLLTLAVLARLVTLEAGAGAGALAALVAAAMPMVSVYGAHVDPQGPPVVALSLATVLLYRRWLAGGSVWPMLLAAAAASAFDWYGLYTLAACALHLFATRRERRGAAMGLGAATLLLFGAWLAWLGSLRGSSVGEVLGSAGIRGAAALQGGEVLHQFLAAWWKDTNSEMPGWPALLVLALLLVGGAVRLAPPTPCARPVLGGRALLSLLLLPPALHALLFPAGLLVHDYWLFGLPPALAAAYALWAPRAGWPVATALALLLLVPGWFGAQRLLGQRDDLAVLIGRALGAQTAPGDVVLTDYDCNPLIAGGGDEHLDKRPEVTFSSDRKVRGLVGSNAPGAVPLDEARARTGAGWFLLTPWPPGPAPGLAAELAARAAAAPVRLADDPPVDLYRLSP